MGFSPVKQPKYLDPSYKMGLDFSDCFFFFQRENPCFITTELWHFVFHHIKRVNCYNSEKACLTFQREVTLVFHHIKRVNCYNSEKACLTFQREVTLAEKVSYLPCAGFNKGVYFKWKNLLTRTPPPLPPPPPMAKLSK